MKNEIVVEDKTERQLLRVTKSFVVRGDIQPPGAIVNVSAYDARGLCYRGLAVRVSVDDISKTAVIVDDSVPISAVEQPSIDVLIAAHHARRDDRA